jgi:hypothetical protein
MIEERLKTLKDFKCRPLGTTNWYVDYEEAKAEAVKWIKKLLFEDDNLEKHSYTENISLKDFKETDDLKNSVGVSWEECTDIPAIIVFIKHFFNLTEEDLGEQK